MQPQFTSVSDASGGAKYSPWVRLDSWAPGGVAVQLVVTGTVSYTLQQTLDDPNSPTNPVAVNSVTWFPCADTNVVNAIASAQTNYQFAPIFCRIALASGSGSVAGTFVQHSVVPV